jgi:tetratricopeptide (TPR) repeat protein
VIGPLGAGGMGIVLIGYDPALERKVALKLLRPTADAGARSAALEREARAMARLAHPNVVTVFEVDRIGDRTFVAMELVEGSTLRGWSEARARSWREIVRMFVAAGRGLAAAHAAGLVHRDFKPDNVLIGGDGRPRISDFGLVREAVGEPELAAELDALGVAPTTRGTAAGTPAYMSPEQWAGQRIDARGDQFAFCVALWETLFDRRPFPGETARELRAAVQAGALDDRPGRRRVPRKLHAALRRGLAVDPAARWPDLTTLLDALARLARGGRRGALLAAALAAAAVSAVIAVAVVGGRGAPEPCAAPRARLAGVWDPPRQAAVQLAFEATRAVYAADTWRRVRARLEDRASAWAGMVRDACQARVERRQSDAAVDLRMGCLERRRAELDALLALWAGGTDAAMVEHAIDSVRGLASLAECADVVELAARAPPPSDPIRAARIAAARARLERVRALVLAHRWVEARPAAIAVRAEADATGWPGLRAEAAFAVGDVLSRLADPGAEPPLLDAVRLAGAARDDRLAARALIALVSYVAEDEQQAPRALALAEIADGAIARAGDDDELRARLQLARGDALLTSGKYDAARDAYLRGRAHFRAALGPASLEVRLIDGDLARVAQGAGDYATAGQLGRAALATVIAELGRDHPQTASCLNNLGQVSDLVGDLDAAAGYYQEALALKRRVLGPEAASTALTMNNLGTVEVVRGDLEAAQALFEGALAIRERVLGPRHGYVATTLGNLAGLRRKQGRHAEALALLERALAIKIAAYGAGHPSVAYTAIAIGEVRRAQGDPGQAVAWFERALEIRRAALGPAHPETVDAMVEVAAELAALGRCPQARQVIATARAALDARVGRPGAALAVALGAEARCDLAAGAAARAVAGYARAVALAAGPAALIRRGELRAWLARARWAAGQPAAAREAAQVAVRELSADADGAVARTALRGWLARVPGGAGSPARE